MTAPLAEADALAGWLGDRVERLVAPLRVTRIGAGQSNITSSVADGEGRQWVVRSPPPGSTAGARVVRREVRILRALAGTSVPVPTVVAEGSDVAGIDGPFYVMDRVPGTALVDERDAARLTSDERDRLAAGSVAVLADLHALAPDAVGLGDLGRREAYVERQTARITENWKMWRGDSDADRLWHECLRRIRGMLPRQQRCVIAHGDYRLSNLLVDAGRITAVLDWELCTLGDPLVDLAWLVDDWRSPDDPAITIPSPTRAGGFPTRDALVGDYVRRTGLDLSELGSYRALTHWKAATLLQGVLQRRRSGSLGEHGAIDLLDLEHTIRFLLDEALDLVGR